MLIEFLKVLLLLLGYETPVLEDLSLLEFLVDIFEMRHVVERLERDLLDLVGRREGVSRR